MKITFLGTKGYIDISSKYHKMHTSTLISYKKTKVLIDCGESWLKKIPSIPAKLIVITHAHPDHAFGLKHGCKQTVFATKESLKLLEKFPILKKKVMPLRKKVKIGSLIFEAFPVVHSINCPAVGYKIFAGKRSIFYVPDVVWIEDKEEAFAKIDLYIGDGATIYRNMVRKSKTTKELFGHATVRQQLTWCEKLHVPKMIITHCGSDIVKNEKKAFQIIQKLSRERNVQAEIAHDNQSILL